MIHIGYIAVGMCIIFSGLLIGYFVINYTFYAFLVFVALPMCYVLGKRFVEGGKL